jgi:hypothetical protein
MEECFAGDAMNQGSIIQHQAVDFPVKLLG